MNDQKPIPAGASASTAEPDLAVASLSKALSTCFAVLKIAMFLGVAAFFLRGLFYVDTGTAVLVKRFGSFVRDGSGTIEVYRDGGSVHYALPFIDRIERVSLLSRSAIFNASFWPKENALAQLTGGGGGEKLNPATDGYTITGDTNILHSQWEVSYRVTRPDRYLLAIQEKEIGIDPLTGQTVYRGGAEHLMETALMNAVIRITAGMPIDEAYNEKVALYAARVESLLREAVNPESCGVEVASVQIKEKIPPKATKGAFDDVINAAADRGSSQSRAEGEGKKILNEAESSAARIRGEAVEYGSRLVADAGADAENLRKLMDRFGNDPQTLNVYLAQYHQQVVQDVLGRVRKYVLKPGQTWLMIGPAQEDLLGIQPKPANAN